MNARHLTFATALLPTGLLATALLAACLLALPASASNPFRDIVQPAFAAHCIQCHGKDGKVKGKVNLLELDSAAKLQAKPELLETLIDVIAFQEMPPEDEPQLNQQQRTALAEALEKIYAASDKAVPHAPIRRMNRFQYNNAVVDLFELNRVVFALPERMLREVKPYFDPASGSMPTNVLVGSRPLGKSQLIEPRLAGVGPFPQDLRAEHGFDNRGDHLSLSTMLLESFMQLSQSVVDSNDFSERNVGIWNAFFLAPKAEAKTNAEKPALDYTTIVPERLAPFLRRAFRRPIPPELLDRYSAHALSRIEQGLPFTDAMKEVASAAIASPRFLYLYDSAGRPSADQEESTAASVHVDPFDLANRLSFFLWGSIPDNELLDRAADGSLTDRARPEILDAQITRMLRDKKTKRFCDSFPAQWLQLERIISSTPDPKHFPGFYFAKYRTSMYMMMEPLLLFETVFVENRSILEFIDSDYTYLTDPLKKYLDTGKGGGNPGRIQFNREAIDDRRKGGLITTAATMTMTSGPEHSNPITRGAWLLTVFFNDPPDPAPADVPPLSEKPPEGEEHLTLRERLSAHRERADCAGCHEKIDPLGFALENYGPTGRWRDTYENDRKVDMQGTLFRTRKFENVIEFKDAILAEKERFARAFSEHVLSFALARSIAPADDASLDQITAAVVADGFKLQTVLSEVAKSEAFRTKSTEPTPAE